MKDRIHVRILVIDDDETVRRRLRRWLEAEEYEVATSADAASGIAAAEASDFELALVDLVLPDANGIEVIERLHETSKHTLMIALGAFTQPEREQAALRAGAGLLEKPVEQAALLAAVEAALERAGIPARSEAAFNRRLGERLRRLRLEIGMTQRAVAEQAGVTPAQLSQIESGKTATSTWTLARIGAALRTPLAVIFEDMRRS